MLIGIIIARFIASVNAQERWLQYYQDTRTESVKLYGNLDEYAYWFADLVVGTPPQRVSVILDTGSSVCAFPCDACTNCGKHIDPPFNRSESSSATPIGCSSDCPGTCTNNQCTYRVSYFEGSSIQGVWFTDLVQLGDRVESNIPVRSSLGCHTSETKLFYTQLANGIMGIGPRRPNSPPSVLQTLFSDERIDKSVFAICLSDEGGELTVGGFNSTFASSPTVWIPMDPNSTFYQVSVANLRIGGANTQPPKPLTAMIDSGSTLAYFPKYFYELVLSSVETAVKFKYPESIFTASKRCFRTNSTSDPTIIISNLSSSLGPVSIQLASGDSLTWTPSRYLYKTGDDQICIAIGDSGGEDRIVLGAAWLLSRNVVFDLGSNRLGIMDANCPSYKTSDDRPADDRPASYAPPDEELETVFIVSSSPTELVVARESLPTASIDLKSSSATINPTSSSSESHNVSLIVILTLLACISLVMIALVIFRHRRRGYVLQRNTAGPSVPYEIVVEESEMVTIKNIIRPQSP